MIPKRQDQNQALTPAQWIERERTYHLLISKGSMVLVVLICTTAICFGMFLLATALTMPWYGQILLALMGPSGMCAVLVRWFWRYRKLARKRIKDLEDTVKSQAMALEVGLSGQPRLIDEVKNENP